MPPIFITRHSHLRALIIFKSRGFSITLGLHRRRHRRKQFTIVVTAIIVAITTPINPAGCSYNGGQEGEAQFRLPARDEKTEGGGSLSPLTKALRAVLAKGFIDCVIATVVTFGRSLKGAPNGNSVFSGRAK